jgi:hypothetical protein
MVIWAIEAVTESLAGGLCNLWNMHQVENETNNAPAAVVFNGSPYCFYPSGNCLEYQYYNGSTWVQETSTSNVTQGASGPGATVFNNQIYLFFVSDNQLKYTTSTDGQTWSASALVIPDVQPQNSPTAVVFNNSIYVFYHQINTAAQYGLLCYVKFDGTTWSSPAQVPNAYLSGSPSAVAFTNASGQTATYVFYANNNANEAGALSYVVLDSAESWQGPYDIFINYMILNGSPSAFLYNGQLNLIFACGTQTYQISSSNASTYDLPLAVGQISLSNTPSVVDYDGALMCTALSPSGGQLGYALTTAGGNWGFMYAAMPPDSVQPTYMSASPGSVVFNGTLYCFTQQVDNGSNINYSTYNGSSWSTQQTLAAAGVSYTPSPIVINDVLNVFYNCDGGLHHYYSTDGHSWNGPENDNSGMSYNPSPVVYDGSVYVFFTAAKQGHSIWFNTQVFNEPWSGPQEVPGLNSSAAYSSYNGVCPPCATVFNGSLYLFYITSDWTIAYRKFNGGNSWDAPVGLINYIDYTTNYDSEYISYTTGNMTLVTYDDPNGNATLAVYYVGYNSNNLYYMTTTNPSSAENWSAPVQAGVPLPQGVTPSGMAGTAVNWDVACITTKPGAWYTLS